MSVALCGHDDCSASGDFEGTARSPGPIPARTDRIQHSSCKMTLLTLPV